MTRLVYFQLNYGSALTYNTVFLTRIWTWNKYVERLAEINTAHTSDKRAGLTSVSYTENSLTI